MDLDHIIGRPVTLFLALSVIDSCGSEGEVGPKDVSSGEGEIHGNGPAGMDGSLAKSVEHDVHDKPEDGQAKLM